MCLFSNFIFILTSYEFVEILWFIFIYLKDFIMEQLTGILPLILIFVVFYFLLIRPQQKKLKSHKEMITNLKKGDKVVTQGGIMGTIHYVNDDGSLSLEVADNVTVKVAKGMIADISN